MTRAGDFSNWNLSYPLVVANVGNGARPWVGTRCAIAMLTRPFDVSEVNDNYTASCAAGRHRSGARSDRGSV